jgi:hypothetical protein
MLANELLPGWGYHKFALAAEAGMIEARSGNDQRPICDFADHEDWLRHACNSTAGDRQRNGPLAPELRRKANRKTLLNYREALLPASR